MVSPAVQGQVPHPSIVPEFLRSISSGMTSARGHGAIVYCLNSGSEDRQTGRHNMLCEGDTRNRWRDGQVCPDVRQGTMAPWARWLGCVLACYAQIGRGRREGESEEKSGEDEGRRKEKREETAKEKERRSDENGREEKTRETEKEKGLVRKLE
ncbi:hypothetical protein TNCV_1899221 [Trichonephila clavipes]|nr:hypothetical protein TNCV_1899221 [Trichonephila clavipes]